jgi:hypothetical protein
MDEMRINNSEMPVSPTRSLSYVCGVCPNLATISYSFFFW